MKHELKTVRPYFGAVCDGTKTAELRRDDRNIQVGDVLQLREWDAFYGYSGHTAHVQVTHALRDFEGLAPGWAMFSFQVLCYD